MLQWKIPQKIKHKKDERKEHAMLSVSKSLVFIEILKITRYSKACKVLNKLQGKKGRETVSLFL